MALCITSRPKGVYSMKKITKALALVICVTMASAGLAVTSFADSKSEKDKQSHQNSYQKKNDDHKVTPAPKPTPVPPKPTPVPPTPTPVPPTPTPVPPTPTPTPTPPAQTWAMYNQYCSGCHGTSKQGKSAATIQNAINSLSAMSSLKSLTSAQVAAIAAGQ